MAARRVATAFDPGTLALMDGIRCRLQPQAGAARLGRCHAPEEIWWRRDGRLLAVRAGGGTARRRRTGGRALDHGSPEWTADQQVRHRGAAPVLPAEDLRGGRVL